MLGAPAANAAKRVRLTVEIPEEKEERILRLLGLQESCEVVSIRRVQLGNARNAFLSPAEVQQPVLSDAVADGVQNGPVTCEFCLRSPCITQSEFKPMGHGEARITNHTKRCKDYKWFWRTLKDFGLWENPTYLTRKQVLGCMIEDIREVMLLCVVKDVHERRPNPPKVHYQGHRRS